MQPDELDEQQQDIADLRKSMFDSFDGLAQMSEQIEALERMAHEAETSNG